MDFELSYQSPGKADSLILSESEKDLILKGLKAVQEDQRLYDLFNRAFAAGDDVTRLDMPTGVQRTRYAGRPSDPSDRAAWDSFFAFLDRADSAGAGVDVTRLA